MVGTLQVVGQSMGTACSWLGVQHAAVIELASRCQPICRGFCQRGVTAFGSLCLRLGRAVLAPELLDRRSKGAFNNRYASHPVILRAQNFIFFGNARVPLPCVSLLNFDK